jgi:uncharacterized protein with PIN domain
MTTTTPITGMCEICGKATEIVKKYHVQMRVEQANPAGEPAVTIQNYARHIWLCQACSVDYWCRLTTRS